MSIDFYSRFNILFNFYVKDMEFHVEKTKGKIILGKLIALKII